MNRTVLAIVVAAVIFGTVWMFRGGKEAADSSVAKSMAAAVQAARTPSPDVVLAIKPGASRIVRPVASAPKVSPLMQEYLTGSRKAIHDRLVQQAARTPEENYVLARILETCTETGRARPRQFSPGEDERKGFAASVSEKDPDRAKRIAAFERMSDPSQCSGFEGVKTDPARIKDLIDQAAAGGEPKARAQIVSREMWACCDGTKPTPPNTLPLISDEQLNALREVVQSGDPQAIMIAGSILSTTLGNLVIRAGADERPIDPRAFYSAWNLVACSAGYDCGPNNATLLGGCAHNGNCGAQNLEEYLYFYGNSPQQSQLINEYRSHLMGAMQTGDWSYFSFVRARPPTGSVYFFGPGGP